MWATAGMERFSEFRSQNFAASLAWKSTAAAVLWRRESASVRCLAVIVLRRRFHAVMRYFDAPTRRTGGTKVSFKMTAPFGARASWAMRMESKASRASVPSTILRFFLDHWIACSPIPELKSKTLACSRM